MAVPAQVKVFGMTLYWLLVNKRVTLLVTIKDRQDYTCGPFLFPGTI